jgi:hypothetical protein
MIFQSATSARPPNDDFGTYDRLFFSKAYARPIHNGIREKHPYMTTAQKANRDLPTPSKARAVVERTALGDRFAANTKLFHKAQMFTTRNFAASGRSIRMGHSKVVVRTQEAERHKASLREQRCCLKILSILKMRIRRRSPVGDWSLSGRCLRSVISSTDEVRTRP